PQRRRERGGALEVRARLRALCASAVIFLFMDRIVTLPPLPARPAEGHKGMFGRVLVVGGNDGMIGAPVFSGTAALRSGAGLVQIAVPRSILHAALSITPELIGLRLSVGNFELLQAADKADALIVGPGMGTRSL